MNTTEIKCRGCGCTVGNCAKCIEKTGAPCWWTKNGLCSACVPRMQAIGSLLDYEKSPLANELRAARNRIAELEVQLADVAFERNQLQAEHDRSMRHG